MNAFDNSTLGEWTTKFITFNKVLSHGTLIAISFFSLTMTSDSNSCKINSIVG